MSARLKEPDRDRWDSGTRARNGGRNGRFPRVLHESMCPSLWDKGGTTMGQGSSLFVLRKPRVLPGLLKFVCGAAALFVFSSQCFQEVRVFLLLRKSGAMSVVNIQHGYSFVFRFAFHTLAQGQEKNRLLLCALTADLPMNHLGRPGVILDSREDLS